MQENSTTTPTDWLAAHRHELSGGGLWLDGGEPGRVGPERFHSARLRVLICRLSSYEDVLPSITHRMLLWAAQEVHDVYADLAFFPHPADERRLCAAGIPPWLATACKQPPRAFDVVAISLSVPQEALNLPAALHLSGLELSAKKRQADATHPLIILGGHAAGSAPFLHGPTAPGGGGGLVDAVCWGDGLTWLREFLKSLLAARMRKTPRTAFLRDLALQLPGTYVPSLYQHESLHGKTVSISAQEPGLPLPVPYRTDSMPVWLGGYDGAYIPFSREEQEETLPLAVGCAYRCRFCQTGWMRGPLSSAGTADLLTAAFRLKASMANSDLNLLASDACSVPALQESVAALRPLFRHLSIKSLAITSLARNSSLRQLVQQLEKHEFTFGIEGISARLRAFLGKQAEPNVLASLVRELAGNGIRHLKLFFIATGREESSDFSELDSLLKSIRAQAPQARIMASFMPLFHAPFTPLQFCEVRRITPERAQQLESIVRRAGCEFRWSAHPDEILALNLLCRLGPAATGLLARLSLEQDLRYTDGFPASILGQVLAFIQENGWALESFMAEMPEAEILPWDALEGGATKAALWKSRTAAEDPPCAAPPTPIFATKPPNTHPLHVSPAIERLGFYVQLEAPDSTRPDHAVARGQLRRLFQSWPEGVRAYRGQPTLLRPGATSGLALLQAEFIAGTPTPMDTAAPTDIPEKELLYLIRLPGGARSLLAHGLEHLRRQKIPFQTIRRDGYRQHIVGARHRARSGIWALFEEQDDLILLAGASAAEWRNPNGRPFLASGTVEALLAANGTLCPHCHRPAPRLLRSIRHTTLPACLECTLNPAKE